MFDFTGKMLAIGIGATALIDLWIYALNRIFGLPMTNWALAGRWFWHLGQGRIVHDDIAKAVPYRHELALGWLAHYFIGIAYAGLLMLTLPGWAAAPAFLPTWIFGMLTIIPGWFLFQPGMGLGWAACRRPNAWQIRGLNIASHSVFAIGLYVMALWLGR
ncbi:DUF2938 domain-containing protein [Labrys neptuniae]